MRHPTPTSNKPAAVGQGDRLGVRTARNPIGIDDIGLPADVRPDGAREPNDIRPDSVRTQERKDDTQSHGGPDMSTNQDIRTNHESRTPQPQHRTDEERRLDQRADHQTSPESDQPSDQVEDEKTAVEHLMSEIVPPSQEVSDDDIMDPGRMTPKAPPVDNRS